MFQALEIICPLPTKKIGIILIVRIIGTRVSVWIMVAIWPFLKRFARKKMIWPFFGLFWMLKKIVYFKACSGEIWSKCAIFYDIISLNLVILTNFWRKFGLYLAFLKLLMAKFGLFNFFDLANLVWIFGLINVKQWFSTFGSWWPTK